MIKILNIEPENYSVKAKEILNSVALVDELFNAAKDDIKKILPEYNVLISRLAYKIDNDLVHGAKNLKAVVSATTGLDHIDIDFMNSKNIKVISLKGETEFLSGITATAEHTWGLILSIIRRIPFAFDDVKAGNWERNNFIGSELQKKTLGIMGYGRIGKIIAEYAKAFRMKVLVYDPYENINNPDVEAAESIEKLFFNSDIISVHIPLNEETAGLIDNKYFSLMKTSAYFINTSRGAIVNENDLLIALKNKMIAGAAVDVLASENSEEKNIDLITYSSKNNNLIITPHIGGAAKDSMENTEIFIAEKIKKFILNNN